jgi:hypothetical protein
VETREVEREKKKKERAREKEKEKDGGSEVVFPCYFKYV